MADPEPDERIDLALRNCYGWSLGRARYIRDAQAFGLVSQRLDHANQVKRAVMEARPLRASSISCRHTADNFAYCESAGELIE